MSLVKLEQFDSFGMLRPDPFCLYAALAPSGDYTFVKMGMGIHPLEKVYELHKSAPGGVAVALWSHVGSRSCAASALHSIKNDLRSYEQSNRWLRFHLQNDKEVFHTACRRGIAKATGKILKRWERIDIDTLVQLFED